jgi:hypothetical protein
MNFESDPAVWREMRRRPRLKFDDASAIERCKQRPEPFGMLVDDGEVGASHDNFLERKQGCRQPAATSEGRNYGAAIFCFDEGLDLGASQRGDEFRHARVGLGAFQPDDIIDNPKNLKIRELEAATLPRVLDQVDLALINTNYALVAGLNPVRDALVIEGKDSPYVNYLVARTENQSDPRVQALATALRSQAVKDFIAGKYDGAVIPAT